MTSSQIQSIIAQGLATIEQTYDQNWSDEDLIQMNQLSYTFALGALSATRKIPGIDQHMGFDHHFYCDNEVNKQKVKDYLQSKFNIHDKDSLITICNQVFSSGHDYEVYRSFYDNRPTMNPNALNEDEQAVFYKNKDFAENFEPFLKNLDCFGYDFNERITIIRSCLACGIIDEECFDKLTSELTKKALKQYRGWKSYAISCACGGALFMYKFTQNEKDSINYFMYIIEIIHHLMIQDRVWLNATWGYL